MMALLNWFLGTLALTKQRMNLLKMQIGRIAVGEMNLVNLNKKDFQTKIGFVPAVSSKILLVEESVNSANYKRKNLIMITLVVEDQMMREDKVIIEKMIAETKVETTFSRMIIIIIEMIIGVAIRIKVVAGEIIRIKIVVGETSKIKTKIVVGETSKIKTKIVAGETTRAKIVAGETTRAKIVAGEIIRTKTVAGEIIRTKTVVGDNQEREITGRSLIEVILGLKEVNGLVLVVILLILLIEVSVESAKSLSQLTVMIIEDKEIVVTTTVNQVSSKETNGHVQDANL